VGTVQREKESRVFRSKRSRSIAHEFALGDKVDVVAEYAANHPERDCSGQAIVAEVSDMLGSPVYGVAFPNMLAGFKFYWISDRDISASSATSPTD
jgi:hypothetical protein